ncbi:MAG TPA: exodeoxyribonuclease VII small subunit [bacterium]|nr:exodeoxyribonuclease VII small subunit [bacterium]
MAKKDKDAGFEQNMEKLQRIVEEVESGELGLEETINKYEDGMKLIKKAREILDKAELKITKLVEDSEKTEPFEDEDFD